MRYFLTLYVLIAAVYSLNAQDVLYRSWDKVISTPYNPRPFGGFTQTSKILKVSEERFLSVGNTWSDIDPIVIYLDCKGDTIWTRKYGFAGEEDEVNSIETLNTNNFIFTGATTNTGSSDVLDGFIQRIDSSGNSLSYKTYGGSQADWFYASTIVNDAIYSCGVSSSSDGDLDEHKGNSDMWLLKTTLNGDKVWSKSIGGSLAETAYSITATSDLAVALAGRTQSSNGDISGYYGGIFDAVVTKVDAEGNIQWTNTFGGPGADGFRKIISTNDGNIIATGYMGNDELDNPVPDFYTVKLSNDGEIIWSHQLGGTEWDIAEDVVEVEDGYIVVGSIFSDNILDISNNGERDFLVVKYDFNGNVLWKYNYGGSGDDIGFSATAMEDQSVLLYGSTDSNDGDISVAGEGINYWLLRLSPTPTHIPILEVNQIETTGFDLTWTTSTQVASYNLVLTPENKESIRLNKVESDTYNFDNLEPSRNYEIKVGYFGYCDYEFFSEIMKVLTLPAPPSNIGDSLKSTDDVVIWWNDDANIDSYELEVAMDENFESLLKNYDPLTTTDTAIVITGLSDSDRYYRIRARNASGYSEYSSSQKIESVVTGFPENANIRNTMIYPNPAKYWLFIKNTKKIKITKVFIYNPAGSIQHQLSVAPVYIDTELKIDIGALKSGTYFMVLETDQGRVISKFVKY